MDLDGSSKTGVEAHLLSVGGVLNDHVHFLLLMRLSFPLDRFSTRVANSWDSILALLNWKPGVLGLSVSILANTGEDLRLDLLF